MINKEQFELHKTIVDWLMTKGCTFAEAMTTVDLAEGFDLPIPIAYFWRNDTLDVRAIKNIKLSEALPSPHTPEN